MTLCLITSLGLEPGLRPGGDWLILEYSEQGHSVLPILEDWEQGQTILPILKYSGQGHSYLPRSPYLMDT